MVVLLAGNSYPLLALKVRVLTGSLAFAIIKAVTNKRIIMKKIKRYNSSLKNKPCKTHLIVLPDDCKDTKAKVCPRCGCKYA